MAIIQLREGQAELPSTNSTQSFWHQEPSPILTGHRTTSDLPSDADVVVVGSGITGAFAARELVRAGRSVVMLEAREACWGATGRNGGRCEPSIYTNNSPEIARFELDTFHFLDQLIKTHEIPCDWNNVGGIHAIPSPEILVLVQERLSALRRDHPDLAEQCRLITDEDGLLDCRVPEAVGAVLLSSAAQCWPYKLVSWVLEKLLEGKQSDAEPKRAGQLFNLQTKTPVMHLQKSGESWIVHTARGQIAASHVLLATNAHTSYLLPKLSNVIVPVRGQVCALRPPKDSTLLTHIYAWVTDGSESDDYLIERLSGELILGGERMTSSTAEVGISHDDEVNPVVGQHLRCALSRALDLSPSHTGKGGDSCLDAAFEWTGIMGYSKDGYPWVGRVPSSLSGAVEGSGLWLSAGYTGHGMPVAARCGIAVAQRITGQLNPVKIPAQYHITEDRILKARHLEFVGTIEDLKICLGG